jgi:hypothetical protein
MGVQLDAKDVLQPVIQHRRLARPTARKDILEKRKSPVPSEDRNPELPVPLNIQ